ncbi:hypothetical protein ACQCN2_11865 [Brevibacillus ginsengisoli]|uniref:hypothetical protein n=1 Tax=Brevibacillus ginsengisoli TaxID=363854 RepID=UPI003CF4CD4B
MTENSIENQIKGMKAIGRGAFRIVYDLGDGYVLKVARSKRGIKVNAREVTIYHSSPSPVRKHLAEIIEYENEYRWLKMKKYTQKFPKDREFKQKLYELGVAFKENGIIPLDISKFKSNPISRNLRIDENGEIVVIDYGNFKVRQKNS